MASAATMLGIGGLYFGEYYENAQLYKRLLEILTVPLDFFMKCFINITRKCFKVTNTAPGSDATASMASALAVGSILFKNVNPVYSSKLLDYAKKIYTFAETYLGVYSNQIPSEYTIYPSSDYWDDLAEASGLLYKATSIDYYKNRA